MHNVHMAGLHTSDRLLLEAVREVNLFYHAGIRTGDPRSDFSFDVDDYLDRNASNNTKKANNQFLALFNDTMEVLNLQ